MAEDHQFVWVGRVKKVAASRWKRMEGYQEAEVELIKADFGPSGDIRDRPIGTEFVTVEDSSLQEIQPGLFFYYK